MLLVHLSKAWSLGTWFFSSIAAFLGHWIITGVRAARRRKPGEPPVNPDGGSFNPYRNL